MLDERDLQAIKGLIDTSVNSAVIASEKRTQAKLDAMDAGFAKKLSAMDAKFEARFKDVDKRFEATDKKFDAVGNRFDTLDASIDEKFAAMENRWQVFFETEVMPKFQLLADGHQNLLDTLAPKARVDALEEDVVFLKSIVKSLMQEVSELKKAQ